MKKKQLKKESRVEESPAAYLPPMEKTIRFFSSFEEAADADARELAAMTPEQHLMHATAMIRLIFADELQKKMDKKIRRKRPI